MAIIHGVMVSLYAVHYSLWSHNFFICCLFTIYDVTISFICWALFIIWRQNFFYAVHCAIISSHNLFICCPFYNKWCHNFFYDVHCSLYDVIISLYAVHCSIHDVIIYFMLSIFIIWSYNFFISCPFFIMYCHRFVCCSFSIICCQHFRMCCSLYPVIINLYALICSLSFDYILCAVHYPLYVTIILKAAIWSLYVASVLYMQFIIHYML